MKVTVDSVRAVLAAAMALGASDVHISPAHQPVFRLAGQLRVATDFEPLSAKQIRALIEQLQVQACVAEHSAIADEVQGQSHWILAYADLGVRVRITAYSTMAGSALALRLLSNVLLKSAIALRATLSESSVLPSSTIITSYLGAPIPCRIALLIVSATYAALL